MPPDAARDTRRGDLRVESTRVDVSDLTRLPGLDLLPGHADGTVSAGALCIYADDRPSARLERHVIDRDQHCRFPGCTAQPARCDVDHTVPWPLGPTHEANLVHPEYDLSFPAATRVVRVRRSQRGCSG